MPGIGRDLGFHLVCCDFLKSLFMTTDTKWERKNQGNLKKQFRSLVNTGLSWQKPDSGDDRPGSLAEWAGECGRRDPPAWHGLSQTCGQASNPHLCLTKGKLFLLLNEVPRRAHLFPPMSGRLLITKARGFLQKAQPGELTPSFSCSYNQPGHSGAIWVPAYQEGTTVNSRFSMAFSVSSWPWISLEPSQGISGLTLHDITWLLTPKPATADPV